MKAWITKYALTDGICEVEGEIYDYPHHIGRYFKVTGGYRVDDNWQVYFYYDSWHETKASAIEKAESMRTKKIESLKKQIAKLEKLRFE